ncbi:hypothetical protein L195_g021796 [Trifolium pratense]|uniref:Uncharacterized protein n=1 Tax=Trifolium pratense TaxID=57577 RepID=A0A2K3N6A6_TRIPR|nr:hypothetical protein L195_g021796 [Trifolium pratense]
MNPGPDNGTSGGSSVVAASWEDELAAGKMVLFPVVHYDTNRKAVPVLICMIPFIGRGTGKHFPTLTWQIDADS